MKKTFLKKLLLVFSGLFTAGFGVYVYGCADGWWGYSYISSFTPEAFADESYQPLFYAPDEKFYDYAQLDYIDKYNEDIIGEWHGYLKNKLTRSEVAYFLLNDTAQTTIDKLYIALQSKKPASDAGLPITDQHVKNFITFLHFAKQIEVYSTNVFSSWNYEERVIEPTNENLVRKVEAYYQSLNNGDDFFRNRMWFQVLKAKFYSDDQASVIPFYEETIHKQPKNALYYRAIGYLGGTYYNLGQFDKSNQQFAILFQENAAKRHEALYNFKPLSPDSMQRQVQEAPDNNIKASLIAMNGYYTDEAVALKQIYELAPKSSHIDFLITRWVNRQEYTINDYDSQKQHPLPVEKTQIDYETLLWLGNMLQAPKKLSNPALVYLAYGYINFYIGEYEKATQSYTNAYKRSKGKPLVRAQIRLLNLMNSIAQLRSVTPVDENKLLADLNWLYKEVPKDTSLISFRYEYATQWIKKTLARVYTETDNPLMAEVLNSEDGYYDDPAKGAAMENFLLKTNKSSWENLFAGLYPYHLSDIYESRAIYAYYQNRLDDALSLMQKADLKAANDYTDASIYYRDAELRGNPFNGRIKDCNDCDHVAPQSVKYTKRTFLQKVKELQTNVNQGTDVYHNALLLGNAFYNTSYFGNARVFYYNQIIDEYGNYIAPKNQPYLLGMDHAQKYYTLALHAATSDEQRAKVSYLLSKIERNNFYRTVYLQRDDYYWPESDQVMFKEWTGFKALKDEYAHTDYYKEVIRECGYFRSYIQQSRF